MEGGPSEAKNSPALPQERSTLEEKLGMTSPNNSHAIFSRPRSRAGRPRNRRRSFESIDVSNPMLSRLISNDSSSNNLVSHSNSSSNNLVSHSHSTGTFDDRKSMMTPNNSNHSFSRLDFQGTTRNEPLKEPATPNTTRGRPCRQRNKPRNRRRSFDPTLLTPSLMAQVRNEVYNNSARSELEEKLAMTSPNNNNNSTSKFDNQIVTTTPRARSRSRPRRLRNRRRSMPQLTLPPSFAENFRDKNLGKDEEKEDEQVLLNDSSGHGGRHKASNSVPSASEHSGFLSYYTEMTVHTDTHLLANDQEETGVSADDSSSCYYSDGGIAAYENKMNFSLAISLDDEEDDSSNSNFNHDGRDNGSHKTLESAFTLSELGSNDSVSSLSVGDDEDDINEDDRRIQFIFTPVNSTRQRQRAQRRASYQSIGRRRRRYSEDSAVKSRDDYEEFTEDEVLTLDGSIPDLPNLPKRTSNDGTLNRNSSSTNEYITEEDQAVNEEMTFVEVETEDEEYIEEVSLNDVSQKRYEILISEESFEEEILIDDEEEEEITVDDDDFFYDYAPDVEEVSVCSVDYQKDVDNNKTHPIEDAKNNSIADGNKLDDPETIICDNFEAGKYGRSEDINGDATLYSNEKKDSVADSQNDIITKDAVSPMNESRSSSASCRSNCEFEDAPAISDEKIELSIDVENCDSKRCTPSTHVDQKRDASEDGQRNCGSNDSSSVMNEKTDFIVHLHNGDDKNENALKSQCNENHKDAPINIRKYESPEGGPYIESDPKNKNAENSDKNSECNSGYLDDDNDYEKPKSYRDILLGK